MRNVRCRSRAPQPRGVMFVVDLCCALNHRFEGWFGSAIDFDDQIGRSIVACPTCNSTEIHRVPSVVSVGAQRTQSESIRKTPSDLDSHSLLEAYRQIVRVALRDSENVGRRFAEEARKIHYEEAPGRQIHGQVTTEEREELVDEGIPILPVVGLDDDGSLH